VAALQEVYEAALARHRPAVAAGPAAEAGPVRARERIELRGIASLAGVQRGMSRIVLDHDGERGLTEDPAGWLARQGVAPPDHEAMAGVGPRRLLVYRWLVRAGLEGVVRSFLPRTIARLGEDGFVRAVGAWLHEAPPRSRFLRDAPGELVEWAREAWPGDPQVPEGLVDLARLEILESEVDAAADPPAPDDLVDALALDRPLVFAGALRLASFEHAVHELPRDEDDRSAPARAPTALLVYRDPRHRVRTLALSPLARAVLQRLIEGEQTVAQAIPAGAAEVGETVDDALLGRMSVLLADLAERGVLRGSRAGVGTP
jgi:hypothetical protein